MPKYHTSSSAVDTTSFMTNNARNYFSFIYEKNRDYIVNRMLLFYAGRGLSEFIGRMSMNCRRAVYGI